MEGRKWEELQTDCLVNVLGRVGIESLLLDIPFVCKSWYKAFLNPLCWKQLNFSLLYGRKKYLLFLSRLKSHYRLEYISEIKFVKGAISWSACATYLELPSVYGIEMSYVADNCPSLKTLVLQSTDLWSMLERPCVIGRFKNLEMLGFRSCTSFVFVLIVYHLFNCQNFTALNLVSERCDPVSFGEVEVMTLVGCLPKLKVLSLKWVRIERENLIKLMNGCVGLVHLDVSDCYGFDGNDEQLLKLASHIPTFKSSRSVVVGFGESDYFCNGFSVAPVFDFNLMIN